MFTFMGVRQRNKVMLREGEGGMNGEREKETKHCPAVFTITYYTTSLHYYMIALLKKHDLFALQTL